MSKRKALVILLTFLVVLTLVFINATMVLADRGGAPNEKAVNGLAHANENSAHHKNTETPSPSTCDECGCNIDGCVVDGVVTEVWVDGEWVDGEWVDGYMEEVVLDGVCGCPVYSPDPDIWKPCYTADAGWCSPAYGACVCLDFDDI